MPNLTNLDAYLEVGCSTIDENLDQESSDGYRQRRGPTISSIAIDIAPSRPADSKW